MLQRGTSNERISSVAVSRTRQAKTEDGLSQTPGELVPADKVEEVLRNLELPAAAEGEDSLTGRRTSTSAR